MGCNGTSLGFYRKLYSPGHYGLRKRQVKLTESQSDHHVLLLFGARILGASLDVEKRESQLYLVNYKYENLNH